MDGKRHSSENVAWKPRIKSLSEGLGCRNQPKNSAGPQFVPVPFCLPVVVQNLSLSVRHGEEKLYHESHAGMAWFSFQSPCGCNDTIRCEGIVGVHRLHLRPIGIVEGSARDPPGRGPFDFKGLQAAPLFHDQVHFGLCPGSPEVKFRRRGKQGIMLGNLGDDPVLP